MPDEMREYENQEMESNESPVPQEDEERTVEGIQKEQAPAMEEPAAPAVPAQTSAHRRQATQHCGPAVLCGGHWAPAAGGNRGGKESERPAGLSGVHEVPPGSLRDHPRGGAAGEQPRPLHGGPLPRGLQGHHPRRGDGRPFPKTSMACPKARCCSAWSTGGWAPRWTMW